MPYRRSQARIDFEGWHRSARALIRTASSKYSRKNRTSDYLLCAAVFLTHARFENFYREIVEYAMKRVVASGTKSGVLPGRMRECQVIAALPHDHLKRFYLYQDQRSLLDKLHVELQANEWQWSTNSHTASLSTECIMSGATYPSAENVKQVFYKIGVSDIYAELNRTMKTDVRKMLTEMNGLRGEMAHIGMPPLLSPSDIGDKIDGMLRVVGEIDRLIVGKFK